MWVVVVRGKAEPVVRPYFFLSPYHHHPPVHRRTRVVDPQILRQRLAERLPELHAKVDGGGEDEQDAQYRLRLVRPDGDEEAPRGGVLRLVWWCVGGVCTSVYVVLSTVVYVFRRSHGCKMLEPARTYHGGDPADDQDDQDTRAPDVELEEVP